MTAWILLVIMSSVACVLGIVLRRFVTRVLQFDELFEMLQDDLETNIKFFEKLDETPLLSNAAEVVEAHRNMQIIKQRFEEYWLRIQETKPKENRKQKLGPPPSLA